MHDRSQDSFVVQAEADSIDLGSCAEVEQVSASLQVGSSARQLIMEGVIQLQVSYSHLDVSTPNASTNTRQAHVDREPSHLQCKIPEYNRCCTAYNHGPDPRCCAYFQGNERKP